MRSLVAAATILVALLAADAKAPRTEMTTVEGEVPPDLPGRWLVVEQSRLRTGLVQSFARLWEIRRGASGVELAVARARLPETVARQLAEAAREPRRRPTRRRSGGPRTVGRASRERHRRADDRHRVTPATQ
jgi:hypothetical protein